MHDDISTASFSVKDSKPYAAAENPVSSSYRVQFDLNQPIHKYEKVDDEIRHEIWYTTEEYDIIKARNSLIVKMMKAGNFNESEDHSFRGLEHKLKEGYHQRRSNKFNGLNAVLEEQDRQYVRKFKDAIIIAELYRKVTQNARESAFLQGLRDSEQSYSFNTTQKAYLMTQQMAVSDRLAGRGSTQGDTEEVGSELEIESVQLTKKKQSKFKKFFGLSSGNKGNVELKKVSDNIGLLDKSSSHIPTHKMRMARRASM